MSAPASASAQFSKLEIDDLVTAVMIAIEAVTPRFSFAGEDAGKTVERLRALQAKLEVIYRRAPQ